jgi:hypothetical protein
MQVLGNDTVMFVNWRDIIVLALLGVVLVGCGGFLLFEWLRMKWRASRRKPTK